MARLKLTIFYKRLQRCKVPTDNLGPAGTPGTQDPRNAVKQEDDGALRAVVDTEVLNVVDIDIDCTRQLQNELYEECQ